MYPLAIILQPTGIIIELFSIAFHTILNVLSIVFLLWMLFDLYTRDESELGNYFSKYPKVIWLVIIIIFQNFGALLYLLLVKQKNIPQNSFDVWKRMKSTAKDISNKVNSENAEVVEVKDR